MKKSQRWIAMISLWTLLLIGCGTAKVPDELKETTVLISEDGQIRYWLTGEFAKEYYQLSELNQMAMEEAQGFNAERLKGQNGGVADNPAGVTQHPVTVENVKLSGADDKTVVVQYLFDGWETYTAFNEEELFYGTVADAKLQGYHIAETLSNGKADGAYTAAEANLLTDRYIVITNVRADIYCPGKVTHVSAGAKLNEDGSVNTVGAEGFVYILLK